MKYQLILQFPNNSLNDFDKLMEIEDFLETELGNKVDIDGHDCGSGEMNIFIFTDNPHAIFKKVKSLLFNSYVFEEIKAAYRKVDEDKYTILYPSNLEEFKIK